MAPDVVRVTHHRATTLDLTFADGTERRINLADLVRPEGVFSDLYSPGFVASATVNADIGTICWSNGADFSPEVLFTSGLLLKAGSMTAA